MRTLLHPVLYPLLGVLLVSDLTIAQGRHRTPPTSEQIEAVRKIVGESDWGLMAEWRQRVVIHRYVRYLDAPEKKQESIRAAGLKQYLTSAGRRRGPKLPKELQDEIDKLEPQLRPIAHKLAYVHLRHLRFDRNLALLPLDQRRAWFARLFPEPFDPRVARKTRLAFEKQVAHEVAARLRPQHEAMSKLPDEQRRNESRKLVREYTEQREQIVIRAVARSVRRLQGLRYSALRLSGDRSDFRLPPDLELLIDRREIFATPRQRELIRWSLRPHRCPLIDFSWLGKRPTEKRARRQFDQDFAALARLELLSEAGIPREVVLQLAAAGSDEDFVRALRRLMGRNPPPPRDRSFGAER